MSHLARDNPRTFLFFQAVERQEPPVRYAVPVAMVSSVNIIMPISLPLLIIREYLRIPCIQMVSTLPTFSWSLLELRII